MTATEVEPDTWSSRRGQFLGGPSRDAISRGFADTYMARVCGSAQLQGGENIKVISVQLLIGQAVGFEFNPQCNGLSDWLKPLIVTLVTINQQSDTASYGVLSNWHTEIGVIVLNMSQNPLISCLCTLGLP